MNLVPIPEKDFQPVRDLELFADGTLIRYEWDEGVNRVYIPKDVSEEIIFALDRRVVFAPGVTLGTLFALVAKNDVEILDLMLTDCFLVPLIAHYRSLAPAAIKPYSADYAPDKIESLELYWLLQLDSETKEFSGFRRPDFHGVGVEQREDFLENDWVMMPKGGRITWSISFSPLADNLNTPLVLNPDALVVEDAHGANYGKEMMRLRMDYTLRDVLAGVFWELSFYGTPEETAVAKKELDARVDDIKTHPERFHPYTELDAKNDASLLAPAPKAD